MNAEALIRSMPGSVTLTVTRSGGGSYVDGVWTPAPTTTLQVLASVQPLNGRDLMRLPEGERTSERVKLYTATELRTTSEAAGTKADTFIHRGAAWQVDHVEVQPGHLKCFATRAPAP